MPKEKLTKDKDGWFYCICGNKPWDNGFYACDEHGNQVEPDEKNWHTNYYVCDKCGRYFDIDTLIVVGVRKEIPNA